MNSASSPRPKAGRIWIACIVLVVAVLIAIVVSFLNYSNRTSRMSDASYHAHGIHLALMTYAGDHEGRFPSANATSTESYRRLFPDYIADEMRFYVPGSAWHDRARNKKPDNDIGTRPDYAPALEIGENHWAYVTGLTDKGPANLPIIADGFSETVGVYSKDPSKKGGVWKGRKAIVVYLDGSVTQENVDPKSLRVMKVKPDGQSVDIFSEGWGTKPENVRNPSRPYHAQERVTLRESYHARQPVPATHPSASLLMGNPFRIRSNRLGLPLVSRPYARHSGDS